MSMVFRGVGIGRTRPLIRGLLSTKFNHDCEKGILPHGAVLWLSGRLAKPF